MFVKSISINLLLGTLIGMTGFFYSGWTPSTMAAGITVNSFPVRNITKESLANPEGIAVDPTGNIWVANYNDDSVSKRDSNGKLLSPSLGFTGGGLNKPLGIAIDATGNVWVANYGNNSVTKLDSSGKPLSPSSGFTVNGLNLPFSITIDTVGNVLVANEGNSITELIGAAVPDDAAGDFSGNRFDLFSNQGEKTMETLTLLGAELLPNELTLLKVLVGIGFVGWMMLLFVQAVWLDSSGVAKNGLDEYGGHYSKKHGGYHCVTGRFAGKSFASKEEMLKLAA
ncbi:MAG: hypothetical protein ACHQYP_05575 [Nitrospiria bacterium]